MLNENGWSFIFAGAIAVLMVAILLIRTEPVSLWVLFVYPTVGALLAHVASRTSPTVEEIAWIETSTIAAACIVLLAALVNLLLIELLYREIISGEYLSGTFSRKVSFFALPTTAAMLWWALERRLSRMRRLGRQKLPGAEPPAAKAPDAAARRAGLDAPSRDDRAA